MAAASLPLGGTLDEYWPTGDFPVCNFGQLTLHQAGDCPVTLTVTDKNVAANSFVVNADKVMLLPR